MENRRWWLLAGAVALALAPACALAVADPRLRLLADGAVVLAGLATSAVLWVAGGRRGAAAVCWRLLAVAPLFGVLGTVLAMVVDPPTPLELVTLRWVPTVPGYVIAVIAVLGLAGRRRLRTGGLRVALEVALFFTACLLVVPILVLGPLSSWTALGLAERAILGAAVVVTSATMAAALTLLGVIESRRQPMALVLLAGAVSLTLGRGLGTSSLLAGAVTGVDASRFLVVAGLCLLTTAVLLDPGPGSGSSRSATATGRSIALRSLLPHAAMGIAAAVVGGVTMAGTPLDLPTFVGVLCTVGLAAAHRWVTARDEVRTGTRLRRSEAWFRSLVSSGGDAVVLLDDELRISWSSPALDSFLGAAAARAHGRRLLELVHPEDVPALAAALPAGPGEPAAGRPDGLLTLRLQDAHGIWHHLEAGVTDLRADADVGAVVLHCRDVTERHAREQTLRSVAYTDPMTGLPNRAGCLHSLERALAELVDGDEASGAAFLLIELDGVVEAREYAGRDAVSRVMVEVGRRLRGTVREDDLVARLGGGAFAVVAHETGTDADQLADRCLAVVEQPIMTDAGVVDLTASVGLVGLQPGLSVPEVLARAELAIRAARSSGPGTAERYEPAMGQAAERRDRLRADLQRARANGQLALLLEPIVSLAEHRVSGVEAVVRWRHPELGDVTPQEFVPIAERAGLIGDIQRWVLDEAMKAAVALPERGAPLRLGVNVPAGYAAGGTLIVDVQAALERTGLAPERLVLEISEATVLSDDERVAMDIATLRLMGVHVALEGFGAGTTSLANLTRMTIDILKLDRALLARIDRDRQARALYGSLAGIGRALGLDVVAEGVETPAQLAKLSGFGVGFAQGFLIARPQPPAVLRTMLEDGSGLLLPGGVDAP